MSTRPNTQLLKSVWSESQDMISKVKSELGRPELNKVIASAFSSGPFYFYVIDFTNMQLTHVSPSIKDIHGLDPTTVTFQKILDRTHPEDMDFISLAERKCIDIVYRKIAPEKRKKYKMSYCFRFKTADGSYQLFNHQAIMLESDDSGRLCTALNIHTSISHLTARNNHKISVIGMLGEPSFLNIDVYRDQQLPPPSESMFSRRESEIIRLMSEGLTSQEIANRLSISPNTVKNHRKNILQKSGCRNTGQLITKCITEGLV